MLFQPPPLQQRDPRAKMSLHQVSHQMLPHWPNATKWYNLKSYLNLSKIIDYTLSKIIGLRAYAEAIPIQQYEN